jgi:cytidylate kinase
MNKNEKFVITINRELGSGGHSIGRKLAEKLGVKYCDKAVINGLQEKYHLSVEEIERLKGQRQGWWADVCRLLLVGTGIDADLGLVLKNDDSGLLTSEEMFQTETEILKGIAAEESCVIAGRSGFYVFRDHPNRLSIFIQASKPFRVERVMRQQNLTEDEARKTIEKVDKMRENYVKEFTKTSRYDARNYDLVISADGKSEDEIVNIILEYIQ